MVVEYSSAPFPCLIMIAGPNGSGKTTLTRFLQQKGFDFGEYINPDDIAQALNGTYEERVKKAQLVANERRELCLERGVNFCFETVMSHKSKIDFLSKAKAKGFYIQLFFVGVDSPLINVDRVELRVKCGGHDVPHDRIIARWSRTMDLLSDAILLSDVAYIFDNSEAKVGGPRLVIRLDRNEVATWVYPEGVPLPDWIKKYVIDRI